MELLLHTETVIDSAHKLEGYKGKCANIHGHSWRIELWFKADSSLKDDVGIIVDFGIVKKLSDILDHKYLNDAIGINPTAENLTVWIYNWVKDEINNKKVKVKIRVYETSLEKQTWCEGGDNLENEKKRYYVEEHRLIEIGDIIQIKLNPFLGEGVENLEEIKNEKKEKI